MLSQRELDEFLGDFHQDRTTVRKIKYPSLKTTPGLPMSQLPVNFLDDVDLEVWAELGEVSMTVGEILNMKEDNIIDLHKAAGETVNLKINGQTFARAEVIIIGNNLGIRVDRIYDPENGFDWTEEQDANG